MKSLAFIALFSVACANNVDALKQACASTETVLTGSYQTTTALYKVRQEYLRQSLSPTNINDIKLALEKDSQTITKVLAVLDAATDATRGMCRLPDMAQEGNIPAFVVKLLQIATDVRRVVTDLQSLTSH